MAQPRISKKDHYGAVFFEWRIPEYVQHQRSVDWYIFMIMLALGLIGYSIYTQNFLFAIIIILTVFLIFLRAYSEPRNLVFQITEDGIGLGDTFYYYREIQDFYIIYDPPVVKKLYFTLKNAVGQLLSVPLDNMNPLPIREKLAQYLAEDVKKETQSIDDQLETILKL